MNLAPIVLFVYNRQKHTQQTIEALQKNELAKESELFIYSDEAKNEDVQKSVDEVRAYIDRVNGFKKITVIKREKNWGLANSIIDGVTKIINEYGKIIVLEDDLLTTPNFLRYMNDSLVKYENQKNVYNITGYSFTDEVEDIDSTYFLSLTSSWSWATWDNRWSNFKRDNVKLKAFIKNKNNHHSFNFNNSYDFTSMAKKQIDGLLDSWAIYWYFCVYEQNGLTLFPKKSMVNNVGFDGSGTHCGDSKKSTSILSSYIPILTDTITEKVEIKIRVSNILKRNNTNLFEKIKNKIKNKVKNRLSHLGKTKILQLRDKVKIFMLKKDIGQDTFIDKTVHITGWNSIKIGKNSAISEYSWLNVNNRTEGHKHIIIGDNCYIGRRNFFSSGYLIDIGSFAMTGLDCKFMGSDHIFTNPMQPYIATGTTNDKIIKLETNIWLGANVSIIGNLTIGRGSIIGAGSLVSKDIPPFSIAVGSPCKVIKRFDFKKSEWVKIDEYDINSDSLIPSELEYKNMLLEKYNTINIPLQACSKNFGDMF